MYRYYCAGLFQLIFIYLLCVDNFSTPQGFSINKDSPPWHFSNNPALHKKWAGFYEFDEQPDAFFDIDIDDLDIRGGYIMLREGRVCSVVFYNIYNVNKKS